MGTYRWRSRSRSVPKVAGKRCARRGVGRNNLFRAKTKPVNFLRIRRLLSGKRIHKQSREFTFCGMARANFLAEGRPECLYEPPKRKTENSSACAWGDEALDRIRPTTT